MTLSNGNSFRVTGHLCAGIQRSPVNSPHKGQWRGAFMFYLVCAWINRWVNNRDAGDLRRYRAHYDVIVMAIESAGSNIRQNKSNKSHSRTATLHSPMFNWKWKLFIVVKKHFKPNFTDTLQTIYNHPWSGSGVDGLQRLKSQQQTWNMKQTHLKQYCKWFWCLVSATSVWSLQENVTMLPSLQYCLLASHVESYIYCHSSLTTTHAIHRKWSRDVLCLIDNFLLTYLCFLLTYHCLRTVSSSRLFSCTGQSCTVCDDAWNVINMDHIAPNSKRWRYPDIPKRDWMTRPYGWRRPPNK